MAPKSSSRRPLDSTWQYCVRVVPGDNHKVTCNFCNTTMSGGVNRLKYHLARIVNKNVVVCDRWPSEVTIEMATALDAINEHNKKRARLKLETSKIARLEMAPPELSPSVGNSSSTAAANRSITSSFFLPRTTPGSQPTLESFNEKKRKEADMAVRRFWYHNSISFNCAKSYFYQPMVDAITAAVPGYKAPSYSALRGKELDEEL